MKYFTLFILFMGLILGSCNSDVNTAVDKDGNVISSEFLKKISFPLHPCDHISREMIVAHFDVEEADLELNEDFSDPDSYYAKCGYKWKKPNFEELEEKNRDAMLDYVMKGLTNKGTEETSVSLSDITKMESPYSTVLVGNFKQYENMQLAIDGFMQLHHVPTKKELEILNNEIDKQFAENGLDEETKNIGKGLTGGIAGGIKFTEISGVGDKAFYDHLNRSLDVLFGTFSFKVFIDSSLNFNSNMEIGKIIAQEVWENL